MKIKQCPCYHNYDSKIKYVDENTINIDGEDYTFDPVCVSWPTIAKDTNGETVVKYVDEEFIKDIK